MDEPKYQMYFNVQGEYYRQVANHSNIRGITLHQALDELIDRGYQCFVDEEILNTDLSERIERLTNKIDILDSLVDLILKKLSVAKL